MSAGVLVGRGTGLGVCRSARSLLRGRFGWLGLAALIVSALGSLPSRAEAQSRSGFDYNGIVHVSWWINEYNNFDQPTGQGTDSRVALGATGANWAGLLVTWYQNDASSSTVFRRPSTASDEPKTPSDDALRFAIRELKARGLKVMLKPHVDAVNGQWRGDFNPTSVDAWFQSYTPFIVHYAQLAQAEGVEGFVMGTEFRTISGSANRDRWIAVINAVRNAYSGVLTYAANATFPGDEFTSVSFWDQLDLIGLDGYFNLTASNNPTLAELISAWTSNRFGENAVANVQNFAASRGKPLIFTEIGYKSTDGANREPWNFGLGGAVDTAEQRDLYEAAFTVWSQQTSFMKGFFWWAWPVPPPAANDGDYNPRGKPAEQVLRSWHGPAGPSFSLSASPVSLTVNQGASGTSAITVTRSGGFTGAVNLTASGLPNGVTAIFNPASATGASSTLTLAASSSAATGTVTVTGTAGGLTRTTGISLTINPVQNAGFTLAPNPSSLTLNRGASGMSTIGITRTGGFGSAVAFSASGLPSGVTASFNPSSATGNSTTLTLTASSSATNGTANVTVTGSGGGLTRTTSLSLTVNAPPPDVTLSATPSVLTVSQGSSATSTVTLTRVNGFTSSVTFAASGLPAGVVASFNPASTTGTSSVVTLAAASTAATGNTTVTLSATGGGLTRTTALSLTVTAAGGGGGNGGVTLAAQMGGSPPWYNENRFTLSNTAPLTALTVTVVVQRTAGISFNGMYNTVGGQIQQSNTGNSNAAAITYTWTLASGQTLGTGTGRLFVAQTNGSSTPHPSSGDTYVVTYTTGGMNHTQRGSF